MTWQNSGYLVSFNKTQETRGGAVNIANCLETQKMIGDNSACEIEKKWKDYIWYR